MHCHPTADPAALGMGFSMCCTFCRLTWVRPDAKVRSLAQRDTCKKASLSSSIKDDIETMWTATVWWNKTFQFQQKELIHYLLWIMTQHTCNLRKSTTLFLYSKCKGHRLIQDFSVLALLTVGLNDSPLVDGGGGCAVLCLVGCFVVLLVSTH